VSPDSIVVKISSEEAGAIAMTPVVVQTMQLEELAKVVVGSTGKDAERVAELLKRGGVVVGGSRFRWEGLSVEPEAVRSLLRKLPDPEPSRPFRAENVREVRLVGPSSTIALSAEAARKRRLFRKTCFFDALLGLAASPSYVTYSYREEADVYRAALDPDRSGRLRESATLLAYSKTRRDVQAMVVRAVEYLVSRGTMRGTNEVR
jgi:hypothetical protein